MGRTPDRPLPPTIAYPRLRRIKDAFRFIRSRAAEGTAALERTKARHVAATYGLRRVGDIDLVKRMKARFRNELSFNGEGK
jgi:hypothetical protein